MNVFLRALPARLPKIPALAIVPKSAVVFSTDTTTAFAAGAAVFMDSLNFSMSKADLLNDFAITSTIRCVSSASNPNPPSVAPAIAAASAKSVPVAAAKSKVASVAAKISLSENPSFANSVCNWVTCFAVNAVDAPSLLASFVNAFISPLVLPNTDAKLDALC